MATGMDEYINRERARFEAARYFKNTDEIKEDLDMLFCMLPTEDVAPIRHGRWINAYPDIEPNPMFMYGICSECGFEQGISKYLNYCPNCGAKMDGVAD